MSRDHRRVRRNAREALRREEPVEVAARHVRFGVDVAEREARLRPGDGIEERDAVRIVRIENAAHRLAPETDRTEQVGAVDVS